MNPTRRHPFDCLAAAFLLSAFSALASGSDHGSALASAEPGEELSGGDATVVDATRKAFNFLAPNLSADHRAPFVGDNSFSTQSGPPARPSPAGRSGLGPLFNARSCSACHFKD